MGKELLSSGYCPFIYTQYHWASLDIMSFLVAAAVLMLEQVTSS